jgi:hypothetical protein
MQQLRHDKISDDQQRQFEAEDIHVHVHTHTHTHTHTQTHTHIYIWTLSIVLNMFKIRYALEAGSTSVIRGKEIYSVGHIKSSQSDVSEILTPSSLNFVASVRERTIPTERQPHVGEVTAHVCG